MALHLVSAEQRPFVRVYHDLEREHEAVWADDAALAAYVRLLALTDKVWPSLAELPRSVRPRPLAKLTSAGVIRILPGFRYEIAGYAEERQARSASATVAARGRWAKVRNAEGDAPRTAPRNAKAMPTPVQSSPDQAKKKNDTTSPPPPPEAGGTRANGGNPRARGANPRAAGSAPRQMREAEKHGGLERLGSIVARLQGSGEGADG